MKAFTAAYAAECAKMWARKKYLVFLCIGTGICVLWALLGNVIAKAVMNASGVLSLRLTPTPMGSLGFFLHILIPFLVFMAATDLFTVERSENTMKAMLVRPVERWKLFTAKILAIMSYAALYLLTVFAVCALLQILFGGFSGIVNLLLALASYLIVLVPLAVLCCFAVLISLLFQGGTLSMFVLLICYMVLNILPILFTGLSQLLFTDYMSWYTLFIGAVPLTGRLFNMLLIVFGYGAVFYIGGSLLFDRKEY